MNQRREELRDALRKSEQNDAYKEWVRERTETLKSNVTAHDVLRHFGVTLKYAGSSNEEQISCPFHGQDKDPSARVYPESARSPSRVWCFVCQERWDIFALYKRFANQDDAKFTQILLGLEKSFGIITPEGPSYDRQEKSGPSEEEHELMDLLAVCERRLRQAKPSFEMMGFFRVSKVLDHLHYDVENRKIDISEARKRAQLILDKIGEKIRRA
jgi:hypothetical protein